MDNETISAELVASEQRSYINVNDQIDVPDTTGYAIFVSNIAVIVTHVFIGKNVCYRQRVSLVCLFSGH